jgi:signal transduction histidine kinase
VLRRSPRADRAEHTPADAVNAAAVTFADWEFDLVSRRLVSPSGVEGKLSNREFNLLAAFVAAPNRVLSRGELLSLSRKFGDEIFERSIDILIFRLRQKIEESGTDVQLIKTQRGAGYIFTPEVKPIRYHIMEAATTAATLEQLGSTTGVNHLLTDVVLPDGMNRRKQAEQEIQKINEDLERRVEERTAELPTAQDTLLRNERLSTLTQLTATVSNELRNPLGVIRTSAYTLRGKLTGGEPRTERMLDRIERNVVRCDRIIDELLDFTRISQLEPEPTFLDVWLEETLNEQNLPSGVVLRLALDRPNLALSLDRDRFRRAIINVFNNACQAMIGDGNEDADSKEHTLTVRTQESAGRIDVIFLDTGPGIPPDVYKRIFEPLYSTKGFGVGLGLPAVKHIMEQHGGGIEIESEEGCGTRVCLWLPNSPSAH